MFIKPISTEHFVKVFNWHPKMDVKHFSTADGPLHLVNA